MTAGSFRQPQVPPRWQRPHRRAVACAALAALGAAGLGPVHAQSEGSNTGRAWQFTPSVSVQQTFTDNYRITGDSGGDAITQATVGLRLIGSGSRLRGSLDYALTGLAYARHSEENNFQNTLRGNGVLELIEDFAFIDATASVAQQQISAFGPTSVDNALANQNRTEVSTFSLSPYVRGRLGGSVAYEARLNYAATRSSEFSAADSSTSGALLSLQGGDTRRGLGWSLSATSQTTDFDQGAKTESETVRATVGYPVLSSLVVSAIGGVERTDLQSPTKESHSISGVQFSWIPSERTTLSANFEDRYFGASHAVNFSFRTPRTVWTFTDSRDVNSTGASGTGGSGNGSVYDLLFRQFASVEPDVLRRDLLVRSYLATYGLNPNSTAIPGFLTAAPTLQRLQSLSLALVGLRSNVVFQASRTNTQRLKSSTAATTPTDDLALANRVQQRGFSATWGHRLTQLSSINTSLSWQRGEGEVAAQRTTLKSLNGTFTTQLGPRTNLTVGARYTQSSGAVQPYTERAVFGNLGFSF